MTFVDGPHHSNQVCRLTFLHCWARACFNLICYSVLPNSLSRLNSLVSIIPSHL